MKVTLEERYKDRYTIAEYEAAKGVIKEVKADECTALEWAEYAAREAVRDSGEYIREVLVADAHTATNHRAYDAYFIGSGYMDVMVHGIARTDRGIIEFEAYLTDIWQTGGIEYKHQMWCKHYRPAD